MRWCKATCVSVLAVAALLGLAVSVSAQPVPVPFADGFQNIAPGAYPGANGWVWLAAGKPEGVYVAPYGSDGNKAFRLDSWPWQARLDYVQLAGLSDNISYEASVYVDAIRGRVGVVGFPNPYGLPGTLTNYFQVDARTGRLGFSGAAWTDLGPYTANTWCRVRADISFSAGTADLYLWDWVAEEWCFLQTVQAAPRQSLTVSSLTTPLDLWGVSAPKPSYNDFYWGNVVYFDDLAVTEFATTILVDVDIKPGSSKNPINLRSRGTLPVAVFSTESFDATQTDLGTLDVAGAGVATRGSSGRYMATFEDLDADGYLDLLVHVRTQDLDPAQLSEGIALVTGCTLAGECFEGSDVITLVPR